MGRRRKPKGEKKVDTKIRIVKDLKDESKKEGVNFSKTMEDALKKILNKK